MIAESTRDVLRKQCLGESNLPPRELDLIKSPSMDNVGDYLVGKAAETDVAFYTETIKKLKQKKITPVQVIELLGLYDKAFNMMPYWEKIRREFNKYLDFDTNKRLARGMADHASSVGDALKSMAKRAMMARKNATLKASFVGQQAEYVLDLVIAFNWKTQRATIKDSSIDPLSKPAKKNKLDLKPSL